MSHESVKQSKRNWYRRNRERASIQRKAQRLRRKLILDDIKAKSQCAVCGEDHPGCLVFHHRDPEQKDGNISHAANYGWSIKRLMEEIEKCDILCANCHNKLHWDERNT